MNLFRQKDSRNSYYHQTVP